MTVQPAVYATAHFLMVYSLYHNKNILKFGTTSKISMKNVHIFSAPLPYYTKIAQFVIVKK
jgi:hypothetical protein